MDSTPASPVVSTATLPDDCCSSEAVYNNCSTSTGFSAPLVVNTVALAGNPNVGKSVFFNAFTGVYAEVSNFPGTTVSVSKGQFAQFKTWQLLDTPGVYGLSGLSEEEQVAENALCSVDVVVNVISAVTLERDLFLTQQLIDWGVRLVVAVNQLDEAEAKGIKVNLPLLAERLQVPVVGCVATQSKGFIAVQQQIPFAKKGRITPELLNDATQLRQLETTDKTAQLRIYGQRRLYLKQWIPTILQTTASTEAATIPLTAVNRWFNTARQQIGLLLLNPWIGTFALIGALLLLYQLIGVWVAGDLVDLMEGALQQHVEPTIAGWVGLALPKTSPLHGVLYPVLAGEFGLLTMTPRYILGVLAPLVFGFNLYLSLLEDCGYLPRLATLSDSVLRRIGLNGRAIIPLILGLGCVTMATISTRVLTSQRERIIANTLLGITIPCSAQLGVIMGMMALAGGLKGWLVYMVFLTSLFLGIGTVLNKVLPGYSTGLVMDLPPIRFPRPINIAKKTWNRSINFLKEATPLFVLGALVVSVAQLTGFLGWVQLALGGVVEAVLHLPAQAAVAFVMGTVRRDFGLAGFYAMKDSLTPIQVLTSLLVMTLFVPCLASATVMWKERGWKEGAGVLALSWVLAFSVGAVACRLLEWFPIL